MEALHFMEYTAGNESSPRSWDLGSFKKSLKYKSAQKFVFKLQISRLEACQKKQVLSNITLPFFPPLTSSLQVTSIL